MDGGKSALITGAAQGFGRAFTEDLVKRNYRVCMVDLQADQGQKASEDINKSFPGSTIFVRADVTQPIELERAFQECRRVLGRLDVVCNNAGIMGEAPGQWERMVQVNLMACIRGTQLAAKYIDRGGVLINVASWAGIVPMIFGPVYAATKHGVVGYTRSVARDPVFQEKQVRVNCLCPGFCNTEGAAAHLNPPVSGVPDKQQERAARITSKVGYIQLSEVVKAFMMLVLDPTKHQATLKITPQGGIQEHIFPKV